MAVNPKSNIENLDTPTPGNRWYPPQTGAFADQEVFQAHKNTLDMLYDAHDKIKELTVKVKNLEVPKSNVGQGGGPINTMIAGFLVTPSQPADGDTLRYSASAGQFKFGA